MTERETEVAVLTYLVDHPSASDSLQGIAEWWLLEQSIATGLKTVHTALQHLIEMKFIIARKRADSEETYCVNTDKLSDINLWLHRVAKLPGGADE